MDKVETQTSSRRFGFLDKKPAYSQLNKLGVHKAAKSCRKNPVLDVQFQACGHKFFQEYFKVS
jgi:hypothetical protein